MSSGASASGMGAATRSVPASPSRRLRVAIVGGGVIGSSIAYFLTARGPACEVTVIERDPAYRMASSALSASSIRQQFSTTVNIRMSAFGIDFFRAIGSHLAVDDQPPDIGLTEPGYLYLATHSGRPALLANHETQRRAGVDTLLLEPAALAQRFPWLATDDLALGSLGVTGEGWYDGYAVLQAFRRKAVTQGARYRQAEAVGFDRAAGLITAVQLADGERIDCDVAICAAGPWAARVAGWAGIDLPVRARRRTVFSFTSPAPVADCPLVIDPSGLWFRPEGRQYLAGYAPTAAEDLDDLPLDPVTTAFDDIVWPALATRVPGFEAARMTGAWAGYYEMNTVDHNAILGLHPACPNLQFAVGFSGHGLQQSPAVGRAIAERLLDGRDVSLDLSDVDFTRLIEGRPLFESNVI